MNSLKTNDIDGARPTIKHHSKQLYTLLKKDTHENNPQFQKHIFDSNYQPHRKQAHNTQNSLHFKKDQVSNLYQQTLKSSKYNTRNLMGTWEKAEIERTGQQFALSANNLQKSSSFTNKNYIQISNDLYKQRKTINQPSLLPFKDIQKILDYSLGYKTKKESPSLKQSQKYQYLKNLNKSAVLSRSGLKSLQQIRKQHGQKLIDNKSPYFPHIYHDYDLSKHHQVNYSGNRYWNDQPKAHYKFPSVKDTYFKKF